MRKKPIQDSLLEQIQNRQAALQPSLARVGDFVLKNPHRVAELPIKSIALACAVSEPTVVRFCAALGFSGITPFKLALTKSLASAAPAERGVPFVHQTVAADDSAPQYSAKVFDASMATLLAVRNQLDARSVERAVRVLARARRIEVYGAGHSGFVALDAQHKLFKLGIACVAYSDAHIHAQSAALLQRGDVVLAISRGGASTDIVDSARIALEQGAAVVALTRALSPLAKLASHAVLFDAPEDPDIYTPMSSRLAQLAVVDVLTVGVALARGAKLAPALARAKLALQAKRL